MVAQVVARIPFGAEALDPAAINPYRVEAPTTDAMKRIEAYHARLLWRGMFGPKPAKE